MLSEIMKSLTVGTAIMLVILLLFYSISKILIPLLLILVSIIGLIIIGWGIRKIFKINVD